MRFKQSYGRSVVGLSCLYEEMSQSPRLNADFGSEESHALAVCT